MQLKKRNRERGEDDAKLFRVGETVRERERKEKR